MCYVLFCFYFILLQECQLKIWKQYYSSTSIYRNEAVAYQFIIIFYYWLYLFLIIIIIIIIIIQFVYVFLFTLVFLQAHLTSL
jgi:hypothetical protein